MADIDINTNSDVPGADWPSPIGLSLGILAVIVLQIVTIIYHYFLRKGAFGPIKPVQKSTKQGYQRGELAYNFYEALLTHVGKWPKKKNV